jgi:DNA-binding response OmpR family regulator
MNEKILLLEDQDALQFRLSDQLRNAGYVVEVASDGTCAFQKATSRPFDLIILDATLPGHNRMEACRDIREAGVANPLLLLTARGKTVQAVLGLKLGADDCLPKPFEVAELLARIEALLRRSALRMGEGVRHFGTVHIDFRGMKVTRDGKTVFLEIREFELLRYLVEHAGIPVTRDKLLREVWGYQPGTFTRTVDVHVAGLRRKLEENPKRPELILTVPGIGYQFGRMRR